MISFWPRAMLKGLKRRAMLKGLKRTFVVVALLLGGVESWAKNVPNWTKMFANKICSKSNKKCSKGHQKCTRTKFVPLWTKNITKGTKNVHSEHCFKLYTKLRVFTSICVLVGPIMALSDLLCSSMAFYGIAWPCIVLWYCMALLSQNMDLDLPIVFSRGHRSKFIWSCFLNFRVDNFVYMGFCLTCEIA